MASFLELVGQLAQETGRSAAVPTTVVAQTGDNKRFVDWINQAYTGLCLDRKWRFLQTEFTFQTVAGTQTYSSATAGATTFGSWNMDTVRGYLTSTGVAGEIDICEVKWPEFRETYVIGTLRAQQGRPWIVTEQPNAALALWPTPDAIYTITGEYLKAPAAMTANADIPLLPVRFHELLVWRALLKYAGKTAAPEAYQRAMDEHRRLFSEMCLDQLPRPSC